MSNKSTSSKTFRLAFTRKKISHTFQSPALKAALLAELANGGRDAALVVELVERIRPTTAQPVQVVAPQPSPAHVHATAPPPMPTPAPAPAPAPDRDESSEEAAVEVMDSEDELVQDMTLSPRREQRLRRKLQIWRERKRERERERERETE